MTSARVADLRFLALDARDHALRRQFILEHHYCTRMFSRRAQHVEVAAVLVVETQTLKSLGFQLLPSDGFRVGFGQVIIRRRLSDV